MKCPAAVHRVCEEDSSPPRYPRRNTRCCTYPLAESAAIAGAGRPQPRTLRSVDRQRPPAASFVRRHWTGRQGALPLLSRRTDHHAANMRFPVRTARTDTGHA
jgi:hypothetical protein